MILFLVGLRCSGKTSVGRRLASALDLRFVDQDELVEERAGKPINRIFGEDGEEEFRRIETEVLNELTDGDGLVVATGGGIVLSAVNRAILSQSGFIIYLHAEPEVLAPRLSQDPRSEEQRPPLTAESDPLAEMRVLYEKRDHLYREVANKIVDASGPIDEVAEQARAALPTL